jgi:hypothetical protein
MRVRRDSSSGHLSMVTSIPDDHRDETLQRCFATVNYRSRPRRAGAGGKMASPRA